MGKKSKPKEGRKSEPIPPTPLKTDVEPEVKRPTVKVSTNVPAKEVKPAEVDEDLESMRFVIGFSGESARDKAGWLMKLDKFMKLDPKERVKRCKTFVDYLANLSKQKGNVVAGKAFIKFLNTPEGMIYFTYMFRPKYRALVVRAVASLVSSASGLR